MNISYRWLQALLPGLEETPQQVADRLAMQGAPVDDVVDIGGPLRDVVIARVIERMQHPNADRLSLCRVDAGTGEELQVVCGAPNVRTGGIYPFAPVGASLPGDVVIRKAKIRGLESQGMLCSARELNIGRDHEGILELHGDLPIGASFIETVSLDDTRLVVDVTPNRPSVGRGRKRLFAIKSPRRCLASSVALISSRISTARALPYFVISNATSM